MRDLRKRLAELGSDAGERAEAAQILRTIWNRSWRSSRRARWADRPAPAELAEAVASGWLPPSGRVVDLGCGTAEIAAWFAERGYQATATDIAVAALQEAARRHSTLTPPIRFVAANLCVEPLPGPPFDILVDRGCLHQLPKVLIPDYVRNLAAMAAPGAKMLLFAKAFRDGQPFADPGETADRARSIGEQFAGAFDLECAEPVYLHPDNPRDPLPGMLFYLSRTPA